MVKGNVRFGFVMSRLVNVPLLIHPRTALTVWNAICGRFGEGFAMAELPDTPDAGLVDSHIPKASRFEGDLVKSDNPRWGYEPFRLAEGGVGVVTVTGELVNRGAWIGANSGLTSYEGIGFQLKRAVEDKRVNSIILDIESPGGEAVGTSETAAIVRAANERKPVYAVVNGMAASAGYALASGAKRIITTPTGIAGSIGVVLMHVDYSKALEKAGITPTLIHAGAHKVEGNPYEPLTDDVRNELQSSVDAFYQEFLKTVAAGRGKRLSMKAAKETEARTYIGAQAVDVGVADSVGTFDEVLSELRSRARRAAGRSKSNGAKAMANHIEDDTEGAAATGVSQAAHDQAVKAARAEGRAEGFKAANDRIAAIMGAEAVKGREAFALLVATESPDMSADSVVKIVGASPAPAPVSAGGRTVADLVSGSQQANAGDVNPGTVGAANTPSGNNANEGNAHTSAWPTIIGKKNTDRARGSRRTN